MSKEKIQATDDDQMASKAANPKSPWFKRLLRFSEKYIGRFLKKYIKPSAPTLGIYISGMFAGIIGFLGLLSQDSFLATTSSSFLALGFLLLAMGTSFKRI